MVKLSFEDICLKVQKGEVIECKKCSSLGIVQETETCPSCDGIGFIPVKNESNNFSEDISY